MTTDSSGNWSGSMEVKADPDDKGYTGTDDYIFKVGKYNSADSSPSVFWSNNESTIKIISTESDEGGNLTNDSSPTISPSGSPSFVKTKTTTSSQPKSYDTLVYHSASVAGAKASTNASASALPEVSVKNQKQINPIIWIGLVLILMGVGSLGYIYLKKNGKIPF